ncbi:MAG: hypothetical protein M1814_004119 [Vezdaea aestivalis]|nr:MAG: hypothetical protein M1814_004119 [Vezdaea aestivalis]
MGIYEPLWDVTKNALRQAAADEGVETTPAQIRMLMSEYKKLEPFERRQGFGGGVRESSGCGARYLFEWE